MLALSGRNPIDAVQFLAFRNAARRRSRSLAIFAWLVAILPVVAAALFVFKVATPMYVAQTRFSIQGGTGQGPAIPAGIGASGQLGSIGAAFGGMGANLVDGYSVRDFLTSRDAMLKLEAFADLRGLLVRPGADAFVRLPPDPTDEQLYAAYASAVKVQYNMLEQTVVLDAYAFSPGDAVLIARGLLRVAEQFSDAMNKRAREDTLKVARDEVVAAEKRAADARQAVMQWRRDNASMDPVADATLLNSIIGQLEGQLAGAESGLALMSGPVRNDASASPTGLIAQGLKDRIAKTRERLAGLMKQASAYEAVKAEDDFATANLTNVRQSLENAKLALLQQQKFVVPVVEPRPDRVPAYPDKVWIIAGTAVVSLSTAFFGSTLFGLLRTRFF